MYEGGQSDDGTLFVVQGHDELTTRAPGGAVAFQRSRRLVDDKDGALLQPTRKFFKRVLTVFDVYVLTNRACGYAKVVRKHVFQGDIRVDRVRHAESRERPR